MNRQTNDTDEKGITSYGGKYMESALTPKGVIQDSVLDQEYDLLGNEELAEIPNYTKPSRSKSVSNIFTSTNSVDKSEGAEFGENSFSTEEVGNQVPTNLMSFVCEDYNHRDGKQVLEFSENLF
mmetsp:Transcript_10081/g.11474  ORF Transcript_10081/g.11474 Transcript_10081/m.11474 type:complete len:124 (+) Transcript_10081:177-548(+)